MTDTIYNALRESHEIQRSLLRKLLRSKPGTRTRIALFTQVRIEWPRTRPPRNASSTRRC